MKQALYVQAGVAGVLATALVAGAWLLWPSILTGLDLSLYDRWVAQRKPIAVSPDILVVRPERSSRSVDGVGSPEGPDEPAPVDRVMLARVLHALDHAGATAVGLAAPLNRPSPPELGGAAGDAILNQAISDSRNLVLAVPMGAARAASPVIRGNAASGHEAVIADPDGKARRVPVDLSHGGQSLLPFGLALAEAHLAAPGGKQTSAVASRIEPPREGKDREKLAPVTDRAGRVIVNYAIAPMAERREPFVSVPLERVSGAVEARAFERLRQWADGRVVVLSALNEEPLHRTPFASGMTGTQIQLNLLNMALTDQWLRAAPLPAVFLLVLALSILGSWLLLSRPAWEGIAALLVLAVAHVGVTYAALAGPGVILPVFTPLCALLLSSSGAALWSHVAASGRMQGLREEIRMAQQGLAEARHNLVVQESVVEDLEEDLDATRAALSWSANREAELQRSVDDLRERYEQARTREDAARKTLNELEHRLAGLQAVSPERVLLTKSSRDLLSEECELMGITTRDPRMLALFREVKKAARSTMHVLLLGEPGTGKELCARALHRLGPRAARPFVAVNMAAISPELFEGELFGHVKGSFTGSLGNRKGYFELAHQGTIFLDEIGELPYDHQAKLLRVLQDKMFYRVGATEPTRVDVRVVAATNKPLARAVAEGWFREDLYFRLKGIVLHLPPLRERRQDLPLLASRIVQDAARAEGREGLTLSREAMALLEVQPWRGNIRELEQCLRQAVALAEGRVITQEDLRLISNDPEQAAGRRKGLDGSWDPRSDQAVLACLLEHQLDMQATARALGWDRATVTQRLKGLGFRALVECRGDHARAAIVLAGESALTARVEAKLREYYQHLLETIRPFGSASPAIDACRKRLKNLPERHFKSVELLIRQYFDRSTYHHDLGRL